MHFLATNQWPSGYAGALIGEENVTKLVVPACPPVSGGLLVASKTINQEYLSLLSHNAHIVITIPDLILHADADLATAFAPSFSHTTTPPGRGYPAPKLLRLSTFQPDAIRQLTLKLLLPTTIPDSPTELYWNTRLIDGHFLAQMTSLDILNVTLTYNVNNPDRHDAGEWLSSQAVRLAVATIVENTRAKIYWSYVFMADEARDFAGEVRRSIRGMKDKGVYGRDTQKLQGRIWSLWMLLDPGKSFKMLRSDQASRSLCALAGEMEELAIVGYKKGGKYGQ
jgi:hypothetical protein